jgi:hypothetical protein
MVIVCEEVYKEIVVNVLEVTVVCVMYVRNVMLRKELGREIIS